MDLGPFNKASKINYPKLPSLPQRLSSPITVRGITSRSEDTADGYDLRSRGPPTHDLQALDKMSQRKCLRFILC
jgi:hypothetical protein